MRKIVFIIMIAMVPIVGCNKDETPSNGIGPAVMINGEEVLGVEWSGSDSSFMPFFSEWDDLPQYDWPIADDKITIDMGYDDGWDESKHGFYHVRDKDSPEHAGMDGGMLSIGTGKRFLPPGEVNAHSVIYNWSDMWYVTPNREGHTEMEGMQVLLTPQPGIGYFVDIENKSIDISERRRKEK